MAKQKTQRCAAGLTMADLSENDRREVEKFKAYLGVEAAKRKGDDEGMCNTLQAAIYYPGSIDDP